MVLKSNSAVMKHVVEILRSFLFAFYVSVIRSNSVIHEAVLWRYTEAKD